MTYWVKKANDKHCLMKCADEYEIEKSK